MIDFMLYLGYALVGVAAIAAIILPLISSLSDPKSLAKSGVGLVALLIVFGVGYALSGSEVTDTYAKFGVDEGQSKLIGGFLTMMYILIIVTSVGIIYTEITKIFK
ncbi:MAG: hypothetical protein AAF363_02595 [Bacteroidota bacterium]